MSGAFPLLVLSPSLLLGAAGMDQTPPGRGSLRVSAISPPPSCTLPLRDFLFPFISLLGVIIPRALLRAEKQVAKEMMPHSLSRAGRRQAGRWGPRSRMVGSRWGPASLPQPFWGTALTPGVGNVELNAELPHTALAGTEAAPRLLHMS